MSHSISLSLAHTSISTRSQSCTLHIPDPNGQTNEIDGCCKHGWITKEAQGTSGGECITHAMLACLTRYLRHGSSNCFSW